MSESSSHDREEFDHEEPRVREPGPIWDNDLRAQGGTFFFGGPGAPLIQNVAGCLLGAAFLLAGIGFFAGERSFVSNFLALSLISLGLRQLWIVGWRKKKSLKDD